MGFINPGTVYSFVEYNEAHKVECPSALYRGTPDAFRPILDP